ncbi:MAG: acyltransferase family protein [Janthinobacterium lividum]
MINTVERFTALDVFRGMTVCFMIIINSSGSGATTWSPLSHADWIGFTPADLVFPSFLFAVGNALSFSKAKYESNTTFLAKVFKRTAIIFLLGYLLYWFPFFHRADNGWAFNPIANTRIMGVLQRIALCYLFGSLVTHYCTRKIAIIISVLLLISYWAFLLNFGNANEEYTMLGNAGTRLDILIMGNAHLYHKGGGPIAFDPEGLLSTLPSIVNVIGGFLAGVYIQKKGKTYESVAMLFAYGALLICTALFWGQFFPIAKKMWTGSFALLTIGIDLATLGFLILAVEIKHVKRGTSFFLILGRNPLAIYLLSELLLVPLQLILIRPDLDIYDWVNKVFYQRVFPGSLGALLFAMSYMLLCWVVAYVLDRKRIYIKI